MDNKDGKMGMSAVAHLFCRLISVMVMAAGVAQADLVRHPIAAGTSIDFGQVIKGIYEDPVDSVADGQVLTRTGVYLTQSGTYDQRLSLKLTVGGLFWWPLPEGKEFHQRIIRFGPGVGQAQAVYSFGDPKSPDAQLQVGLFPIKYNPDAKNLGEYLYRSGTYPGVLYSGGWSYLNAAAYMAQGIRFSWNALGGKLISDFSLTMERDLEPAHNLSPSYILTWKPAAFIEFGAGAIWAHGIPVRHDSILAPRGLQNAYVDAPGNPMDGKSLFYGTEAGKPHYSITDSRVRPDGDSAVGTLDPNTNDMIIDSTSNGIPREQLKYFTFRGVKTMARASMDFGLLMGMQAGAFKVYGEWALLGVGNQPFFYEDRSERMPLMAGFNIPTFKLLDLLGLEVEYRKSRFPNSIRYVFSDLYPIPVEEVPGSDYSYYDLQAPRYTDSTHADFRWLPGDLGHADPLGYQRRISKEFKKDDWKWSVYARKQITPGFTVHAQAASDHLRHIRTSVRPMYFSATQRPSQWYYVLRLDIGI